MKPLKQLIEARVCPATTETGASARVRVRVRGPKGIKFYPYTYEVDDEARHAAERYAEMVLGEEVVEEVDAPHVPGGVRYFTATITYATPKSFASGLPPKVVAALLHQIINGDPKP